MTESDVVLKVVEAFQLIAKANDEVFLYHIGIDKPRPAVLAVFTFVAKESVDGHVFADGKGSSMQEAALNALDDIEATCNAWGYKVPKLPRQLTVYQQRHMDE